MGRSPQIGPRPTSRSRPLSSLCGGAGRHLASGRYEDSGIDDQAKSGNRASIAQTISDEASSRRELLPAPATRSDDTPIIAWQPQLELVAGFGQAPRACVGS